MPAVPKTGRDHKGIVFAVRLTCVHVSLWRSVLLMRSQPCYRAPCETKQSSGFTLLTGGNGLSKQSKVVWCCCWYGRQTGPVVPCLMLSSPGRESFTPRLLTASLRLRRTRLTAPSLMVHHVIEDVLLYGPSFQHPDAACS